MRYANTCSCLADGRSSACLALPAVLHVVATYICCVCVWYSAFPELKVLSFLLCCLAGSSRMFVCTVYMKTECLGCMLCVHMI